MPPVPFAYTSVQIHATPAGVKTRRVHVKNGKGFKEVVVRKGRTATRRSRKPLTKKEIRCIRKCQFVPGLFKSCEKCI